MDLSWIFRLNVRQGRHHDYYQIDMFLAEKFDMSYIDEREKKKTVHYP